MGERGPEKGHAFGAAAVAKCLKNADFPMSKKDIMSKYGNCEVEWRKGETRTLQECLGDIPEESFNSPVELEKAIKENM